MSKWKKYYNATNNITINVGEYSSLSQDRNSLWVLGNT